MDEKLPDGWALTKISDIADIIEPGFPYGKYNTEGIGIPHLRPMNINKRGHLSLNETKYVNRDDPPLLNTGDILFNNTNSPVWVGKTTIITQSGQYTFSNHMTRLTLNSSVGNPQFFALQLQYMQQSGYFLEHCVHHVNQASISSSYLANNIDILVAPVFEQHSIVSIIEQQFTRLDSAVASLQNAKARIKQYRASLLKAAVEGELTKEWRAEHSASETGEQLLARILQERRARWEEEQLAKMHEKGIVPKDEKWKEGYKEPEGADVENLPELPEGWCWATVEQVVARSEYGTSVKCDYNIDGIPVLRIPNIAAGKIDLRNMKYAMQPVQINEDSALQVGDLLVCRTNGSISLIGKAALIKTQMKPFHTFASYLLRFRLVEISILPLWFHLFIGSAQGRHFIETNSPSSAGQHNISLSLLHSMPFPLPPLIEQEQIVGEVDARISTIEQMETSIEDNLKRAERERQSILQEAFAGRLVPQDPHDEPASILLERIREERKKRAEEEKVMKVSRKGIQMGTEKKRRTKKVAAGKAGSGLYEVLAEAEGPLRPEEAFKQVDWKTEDQSEAVQWFYEALQTNMAMGRVKVDNTTGLIEALEAPLETGKVLENAAETDIIVASQEDLLDEKMLPDWPTLWGDL